MLSISFPLAFVAGLLSFISPCVLPLVPVYLGYLSGSALSGGTPLRRWQVFSHALFFVGGFTLIFVTLFGLPATILANVLARYSGWITKVGGVILILFGLHTVGVVTIPILNVTRQLDMGRGMRSGYIRSALFGVTFAAGWTPCIGPLLGTVMTLAFTEPSRAMGFLFVYALGLAAPFLATAMLLTRAVGWLKRFNRCARAVEIASGLLVVGIGLLLVSDKFSVLNSYFIRITPEWLLQRL
ncbi:MAG: cytochrome c biogenesis CcdA family protein [Anaerolineae bacterium]